MQNVREGDVLTTRAQLQSLLAEQHSRSTEVATRGSGTQMEKLAKELATALEKYGLAHALLGRFNGEQPPVGSVLRWIDVEESITGDVMVDIDGTGRMQMKRSGETVYVAHRINLRTANGGRDWLVSPPIRGEYQVTWQTVLDAVGGESAAWLSSKWNEVPAAEKLSAEDTDPTAFAERMFGKQSKAADPAAEASTDTES